MEPGKTVEELNAEVRFGNVEFERLEPAGKRIAIAKDVLRQLDAKKIAAETEIWMRVQRIDGGGPGFFSYRSDAAIASDDDLAADVMPTETCSVCAVGALFFCALKVARNVRVGWLRAHSEGRSMDFQGGPPKFIHYLEEFFQEEQIRLIEMAFEGGWGGYYKPHRSLEFRAGDMFSGARSDWNADRRMRALMENIIRNYGNFDPTDLRGLNLLEAKEATA